MRQVMYSLQFTGSAAPAGNDQTVLHAKTTSVGDFDTVIDDSGVDCRVKPTKGGNATFESEVRLNEGGTFT